jgi:hypothetical protein
MQTVRSFDRLSFIHSSIPLSMTPALSSADTEKIFQKRSKEELVSFFCFGPRSKGNLGLSIKSFTGSVGSRDREE